MGCLLPRLCPPVVDVRFAGVAAWFVAASPSLAQTPTIPPPAAQNPSPMVERSRAHTRLPNQEPPGIRRTFSGPAGKPVQVFVPLGTKVDRPLHLVVHFLGAAFIPEIAVSRLGSPFVSATV